MFKRTYLFLIAITVLLVMSGGAQATPMYYTFTGITNGGNDNAGAISAAGLNTIGSAVSYTFMVDTAINGTARRYDGSTFSTPDTVLTDFFFNDLLSPNPIVAQNGGYAALHTASDIIKTNTGLSELSNNLTFLIGGSNDNFTQITNPFTGSGTSYLSIPSWTVGTTGFVGYTMAYNDLGLYSYLSSDLTLKAISTTNPFAAVPEASTLLLLASGLAGLGFIRKKFAA